MKNVWLVDVDIDGLVDRLVVNGVDVSEFVNQHDLWYPLRSMLRPHDIAGVHAALDALDGVRANSAAVPQVTSTSAWHLAGHGEYR